VGIVGAAGQRPDHFYFWLLFDRFTSTIYDVIPTQHVKHLPPAYQHALSPFKYILSETGRLTDFAELCKECKVAPSHVDAHAPHGAARLRATMAAHA